LCRIELLTLGAEEPSNEQINFFFQQLDLLTQLLFVGFKFPDSLVLSGDEFLKCNFLLHC